MQRKDFRIAEGDVRKEPIVIDLTESSEISVNVERDASVHVYCLQTKSGSSPIRIVQRARVAAGGSLRWFNVTIGGDVHQELISECTGANASSSVDWIFSASDSDRLSLAARNIFQSADGSGEITIKGVASGASKTKCDGMIEIGEKGKGTETYLTENMLMLDPTAHVDAVPALEIRTNDVKASHSATITRVTKEDLFYIQSRGIDPKKARAMFVGGFLGDLTDRIMDVSIRDVVLQALR
jgi:Fe-S cluster assembly scaffold protein SufB